MFFSLYILSIDFLHIFFEILLIYSENKLISYCITKVEFLQKCLYFKVFSGFLIRKIYIQKIYYFLLTDGFLIVIFYN